MGLKDFLLRSIKDEVRICKHLFTKISPETMEYRPAENMRSTFELLQYLTWTGAAGALFSIKKSEGADTKGLVQGFIDAAKEMKPEDFPGAMDKQYEVIEEAMKDVTEEDLAGKETMLPWGTKVELGFGLQETAIKWLTGYRMQLFLYIRMNGAEVSTINNWMGIDPVREKEEETA